MKIRFLLLLSFVILCAGCLEDGISDTTAEALEKNDPTICARDNDSIWQRECLEVYATSKNDPSACLLSKKFSEECVSKAAIEDKKIDYCDVLTDPVKKYTCVAKVVGDNTGKTLDELYQSWKDKGRMNSCYLQCEKEYNHCTYDCRDNILMVNDCEQISDVNARSECSIERSNRYNQCNKNCENTRWNDCVPPCKTVGN